MRRWLCVLPLLLASCASRGVWREVETPHFLLRTDLGSEDAKRSAVALEATRDALVSAIWSGERFKETKISAYIFANPYDFEHYFGYKKQSIAFPGAPRAFFLYGGQDKWELRREPGPSIVRHEMAHVLSADLWPHQPRWFAEGWAQLAESVHLSEDDRQVVFGGSDWRAPAVYTDSSMATRAPRAYVNEPTAELADALVWNQPTAAMGQREIEELFGVSWLFVFWLYHERPRELRRYTNELARDTPAARALQIALPNLDPAAMDPHLYAYQRSCKCSESKRPLLSSQVTESSVHDRLLEGPEIDELKKVFAAASRLAAAPAEK